MQIDDDDGYIDIELAGRDAVRLDLFEANDEFVRALDGLPPEAPPKDYYARMKTACRDLGFGDVSGTTAERIKATVFARVAAVRGKDRGPESVTSPAFTNSPSST